MVAQSKSLAAYRLGDLLEVAVQHNPPYVKGTVGKVVEVIEQADGYWYHLGFGSDWMWFKEADLKLAKRGKPMNGKQEQDGWEVYVPARHVGIKIRSDGKLVLSPAAHEVLGDSVEVLWHAERGAIGVRPAKKQDSETALPVVSMGGKRSWLAVGIEGLIMRYHLIGAKVAGEYKAVEEDGIFVLQLPAASRNGSQP